MRQWFRKDHPRKSNALTSQRPMVEALEDRLLLSTTVVEVENNDKKNVATVFVPDDEGVQLQGISTSKKDKDYFQFTASATQPLAITVHPMAGNIARMQMTDELGNDIFSTHPKKGLNSGVVDVVEGVTYFLRMRSWNKAEAQYLVDLAFGSSTPVSSVDPPGSVVGETEMNDFKGMANPFQFDADGIAQLTGSLSSHKDKDYFVFTAAADGNVDLVVVSLNGHHAKLKVENSQEATLLETEPKQGIHSGSFAVVAGETYFIRLKAQSKIAADYQVDLTFTAFTAG